MQMMWMAIAGCVVSFVFFIVSDFFHMHQKSALYKLSAMTGLSMLLISTAYVLIAAGMEAKQVRWGAGFFAVIAFCLLVYSLFFALPAKTTYVAQKKDLLPLKSSGMYALCRHPGVIWLSIFYCMLWISITHWALLWTWLICTGMDLFYVVIQDRYIFPKTIENYEKYKEVTPFLIPTIGSIRRAVSGEKGDQKRGDKNRDMKFEEKLRKWPAEEIWQEYCGFLDLSIEEYMNIQERLLMEQIDLLSKCGLGKKIFKENIPQTVAEFRKSVPLSTFSDYANVLLPKHIEMLPAPPVLWLQTTWEGGDTPAKIAPYSEEMLNTCRKNTVASIILATSTEKGKFRIKLNPKMLYALAPLPYITGMIPDLISSEMRIRFLPSLKDVKKMTFSQKSRKGFELGLKGGMDLFFGLSSVMQGVSKNFDISSGKQPSLASLFQIRPSRLIRMAVAKYKSKRDNKPILPKDLFTLAGFCCVGTDSALYKDELEEAWGIRPIELAGGTETSCLGIETWSKNGLVLFPDACFYEFIPENEMMRSFQHPGYQPKTHLMNEVVANQNYELVITVLKGGAFVRYRVGDVYRCVRVTNRRDALQLPQFEYVDRIPTVIDIAGFTRITEKEIQTVINLSSLPISDWFALKEYDSNNHSFLHIYLEISNESQDNVRLTPRIIKDHMNVYFRYYDGDYKDLKKLLGIDPLKITLLKQGTIRKYKERYGVDLPKINPGRQDVIEMLRTMEDTERKAVLSCE